MKARTSGGSYPLVTVICDNYTARDDMEACWGFSCLINHRGTTTLFDTGSDGLVLSRNMARLGIDPADIDLLMISHQHWDHTGGIYTIVDVNRRLEALVPKSFSSHFKQDMKRYGIKVSVEDGPREIYPGFFTTGEMGGHTPEQAVVLKTQAGIVVITGCAHPGIVMIVQTAKGFFPEEKIALVMGGFHILDNTDEEILGIIAEFKSLGVRYAAPSHCSGERARKLFPREYGKRFIPLGAGMVITEERLK
ncbi:MAG TPA: MBL fold metallo-hydrolase [Smithellaceae bacterium]|jgi:7,8-dihydropterin-6-yl-methyl-4-(beta-D-ribofuranosyl)aminobenzene 5'-phosphate synthase|nr:MBL fold metallo-hydrolase [Syntrophaceae bacterium]HPL97392.1 MBL fold metallo-hydrolase [Smithellaceae bacterium]HPV49157.1 MBL fold metallo-hydrolase [Smithellaceae bacterium]